MRKTCSWFQDFLKKKMCIENKKRVEWDQLVLWFRGLYLDDIFSMFLYLNRFWDALIEEECQRVQFFLSHWIFNPLETELVRILRFYNESTDNFRISFNFLRLWDIQRFFFYPKMNTKLTSWLSCSLKNNIIKK